MNALFPTIFSGMIVLSVALLVIGIVKPEWIRFGQKQPSRPTIIAVSHKPIGHRSYPAQARCNLLERIMLKL